MKDSFLIKVALCTIMLFTNLLFSQNEAELPHLVPVSPNSADLARFGAYEVNPNLGRANISVPLYTIQSGNLQLPISINYNSSGIRLNERASWIGLGWSLQAGGAIIRNVKGAPDNWTSIAREDIENLTFNEDNYRHLYKIWRGTEDGQPDKYTINAYGINATFYYIERNGVEEIVFESNDAIQISNGYKVVKNDGTTLIFNSDGVEETTIPSSYLIGMTRNVPTSFYLSEIISADKKDSISFEYKTHLSQEVPVRTSDAFSYGSELHQNTNFWNNRAAIKKKYLNKIIFKNGYVEFESFLDRNDLVNEYRLDNLKVFSSINNTDQLIKEIYFNHQYYNFYNGNSNDEAAKTSRLKLESVTVGALSDSNSQKTEFEYDTQSLPARGSSSQDFWGYINNNGSTFLLPPTEVSLLYTIPVKTKIFGDANRDAHPTKMKSGVLTKIKYPTGGYTEFEFEANQFEEIVNTPNYVSKYKSILAVGSGDCPWPNSNCVSNGYQSLTFTVDQNPLGSPVDEKLIINITDAFSGSGSSNSYGKFSGLPNSTFERPAATDIYPGISYNVPISLAGGGTYTIEAEEFGHGSNPPSYVPSVAVSVTWKEQTGSTSNTEIKYVGGLRIKSIKNYDGVNALPTSTKNYTYQNPNIINKQKEDGYVIRRGAITSGTYDATITSSPNLENGINLLPTIEYGKITEYYSDTNGDDNGKKVYTYYTIPLERDLGNFGVVYKHPQFDISLLNCNYTVDATLCNHTPQKISAIMSNYDIASLIIKPFNHGSLKKEEYYKNNLTPNSYTLISDKEFFYNTVDESFFKLNYAYPLRAPLPRENWNTAINPYGITADLNSLEFYYRTRKVFLGKKLLTSTIERQYDSNGENPAEIFKNYTYNGDYLLSGTTTTNSKGHTIKTNTYYPNDVAGAISLDNDVLTSEEMNAISLLQSPSDINPDGQHHITKPIQTETIIKDSNGVVLSKNTQRTSYKNWGNDIVLPKSIRTLKGDYNSTNTLEARVEFHDYYDNGNAKEVSKADGVHAVYVWGYNEQYPIAKIENATFTAGKPNSITTSLQMLINNAITASVNEATESAENNLRDKLQLLREGFPNAMITTYTYDPLIGVTSITDPRGNVIYYEYDEFNRLKHIKDKDGNILSQNEYHYKPLQN